MRAAYMPGPGRLDVGDFPDPRPVRDGDVLVQMHYASVCGSDLHMLYDGLHREDMVGRPGYPGHEGVGAVVESCSAGFPVGTPVLALPPGDAGGCFAELQVLDDAHLVPLPIGGALPRLLMAQQLGTAVFALKAFGRAAGRTAVVIGAGSAGLFFLQLLAQRFEQVLVSEPHPGRLAVAQRLGATPVRVPDASLADAVAAATGGAGADLVVETAGLDACRAEAVDLIRKGGTVGCFGYPERVGLSPFPVQAAFRKAAAVHWVSGAQAEPGLSSFREAVRLVHEGEVEVDFCLQHTVGLEDAVAGVQVARAQGAVIKIVVDLRASASRSDERN